MNECTKAAVAARGINRFLVMMSAGIFRAPNEVASVEIAVGLLPYLESVTSLIHWHMHIFSTSSYGRKEKWIDVTKN